MPTQSTVKTRHLLRSLNIFGMDHLDPVFLAALADERPMLLIGAHGTAKSELLNRIAAAMQLEHRHFNASLISFDDLLGYPVPNAALDGLTYLRTPGDLWDAESVFLDEISRCRPETQNKLFSVIHERRVQGLPLTNLRYRWAAMNPPDSDGDDGDASQDSYSGSIPLDPALADRFVYVMTVPRLLEMSVVDRRQLLDRGGETPTGDGGLAFLIADARSRRALLDDQHRGWAAAWMDGLTVPLSEAQLPVSSRRAVMLVQSALSLYAACGALNLEASLADAAYLALKWGLPYRAMGKTVQETLLRAAHSLAERAAGEPEDSPWRAVRAEPDPVRRVALALRRTQGAVDRLELSQLVQDALASLIPAERHALAMVLAPLFTQRDVLTAAAFEQLALLSAPVLDFAEGGQQEVMTHRNRSGLWNKVLEVITGMKKQKDPLLPEIGNLLYALFAIEVEGLDPGDLVLRYKLWRELFAEFHGQAGA